MPFPRHRPEKNHDQIDFYPSAPASAANTGVVVVVDVVVSAYEDLTNYDAVVVTDIVTPQGTYNILKDKITSHRLLTLRLLHISREAL